MKWIILPAFLVPSVLFGQVVGKITDSETGQPISFASVGWGNGSGILANHEGVFHLPTDFTQREIYVSCVGYESDTLSVNGKTITVKLTPKVIELLPVVVTNGRIKLERLGADQKSTNSNYGANEGFQIANFIPHPDLSKKYHVRNILYSVKRGISGSEETKPKNSFFRVRIYEVGADGLPGDDLLDGNLVITPDINKGWMTVDVSSFGLIMPTKGFFVAMEWIEGTPSAEWTFTNSEGERVTRMDYGHSIRMHKPLNTKVSFWTYSKKKSKKGIEHKWINNNEVMPDNWPLKGKVAGIAIEVLEL